MSEADIRRAPHDKLVETEGKPSGGKPLVERAPADAIEPALLQSGNPPRAFEAEDR